MRKVKLGSLFADRVTSIDPRSFPDETFELWSIPASDVGKPEIELGSSIGSTKKCVKPNDVMLSKIVPHIRRAVVVTKNRQTRQIASSEWIIFRSPEFWPAYLRHLLVSDSFHKQFMNTTAGVGGSLVRARPNAVAKIEISLPSLDEQRGIAAILDQADDLRRKRRLALERLDALREARYRSLATEPGADIWPRLTVNEIAETIRTGPFGSQLLHSEFVDDGIAVLGIDNTVNNEFSWSQRRYISEGKYRELVRYTVRPGDVLITIMGTCGRCAIVPNNIPRAINTKHLCCIRLDPLKCLPEFLHAAFIYDLDLLAQLGVRERGAVMPGLNMQLIKETSFRVPPIDVQTRLTTELKQIKALELIQRQQLDQLNALFASLQHKAFAGELVSPIATETLASMKQKTTALAV